MSDPTHGEAIVFAFTVREQCVERGYRLDGYTEEEIWNACFEMSKRIRRDIEEAHRRMGTPMDPESYRLTPPEIAQMLAEGHPAAEGLLRPL